MLFSSVRQMHSFRREVRCAPWADGPRRDRYSRLKENEQVVSMLVLDEGDILTATERGFGKRTRVDEHSPQGRGGQGVIGIQTSERNGALVRRCRLPTKTTSC